MKLNDFKLERFFAEYEFSAKYLLSASDCESVTLREVLSTIPGIKFDDWKDDLRLGYTESQGSTLLRAEISKFYNQISIDNIVVASPGELNFSLMNVLLSKNDHVICIQPAYQSLYEIPISIGCKISFWKFNIEAWKFEIDDLKALFKKNTKLIIINFPHNPTGSYLTPSELNEIIHLAKVNNCYIFSDEMYHKLLIDESYQELAQVSTLYDKGISLWGMSKTFGMPGLRIGWLVSQDKKLIEKIVAFKDYLSICSSMLSEEIACLALRNHRLFITRNKKIIQQNLELFEQFTSNFSAIFSFNKPIAGSIALLEMISGYTATRFTEILLKERNIMCLPSSQFDMEDRYIRIGLGRKTLSDTIPLIKEVLIHFY